MKLFKSKNSGIMIFEEKIVSEEDCKDFINKIGSFLINRKINKSTKIIVKNDKIIPDNKFNSFKKIESYKGNIYEYNHYSGKKQHYIQKYFMYSFFKLYKNNRNMKLINIDNFKIRCSSNIILEKNTESKCLNDIASKDYFFSPERASYLDRVISSYEKKSEIIIREINKHLDYNSSLPEVKNIIEDLVIPMYMKNIHQNNEEIFNIKVSKEKIKKEIELTLEEEEIVDQILTSENSNYEYFKKEEKILGNNCMKQIFNFSKIRILKLDSNLPLTENLIFFTNSNDISLNYSENVDGMIFIFNESTILFFYKKDEDKNKEKQIKKTIKNKIIDFANDFILSEDEVKNKVINEPDFVDYSKEIKKIINDIRSNRVITSTIYGMYKLQSMKNESINQATDEFNFYNCNSIQIEGKKDVFVDNDTFTKIKNMKLIRAFGLLYRVCNKLNKVKFKLEKCLDIDISDPIALNYIDLYERTYEKKTKIIELENDKGDKDDKIAIYIEVPYSFSKTTDTKEYIKKYIDKKHKNFINNFKNDSIKNNVENQYIYIDDDVMITLRQEQYKKNGKEIIEDEIDYKISGSFLNMFMCNLLNWKK